MEAALDIEFNLAVSLYSRTEDFHVNWLYHEGQILLSGIVDHANILYKTLRNSKDDGESPLRVIIYLFTFKFILKSYSILLLISQLSPYFLQVTSP